ncbi:hypothetical protein BD770DRAFT_392906 [Pilaira anomala]|nr:hypothetical protein BD770DRAFT_392906 [Pilaira anomala]
MEYQEEYIKPSKYKVIRWLQLDEFAPERAFTSFWVSPKVFFIIRIILALYTTIVFWTYLAMSVIYARFDEFFAFFTTLTFVGIHAYFVTSCVYHFRYLKNKNVKFLLKQPSFLNYMYVWLYCTIVVFNVLTPVVFWSILNEVGDYTENRLVIWLNLSVHGITLVMTVIEVIFNRMRLPIRMILPVFFTVLLYMFLAFIIFASKHVWVYSFLAWDQGPKAALWYFVVAIMIVVIFFVMLLIHLLRDYLAFKFGRSKDIKRAISVKPEAQPPSTY